MLSYDPTARRAFLHPLSIVISIIALLPGLALAQPTINWCVLPDHNGAQLAQTVDIASDQKAIVCGDFRQDLNFGCSGSLTGPPANEPVSMYIAKLRKADGACNWQWEYGNDTSLQRVTDTALGSSNDVIMVGYFDDTFHFGGANLVTAGDHDAFVAKLSYAAGTEIWSARFGDANFDQALHTTLDSNDDVIVVGYFSGEITFGLETHTSWGAEDMFVVKLDGSTGAVIWSTWFGGLALDTLTGVHTDSNDDVIIVGRTEGTINFGGGPLDGTGKSMCVLAKISGVDASHIWSRAFGNATTDVFSNTVDIDGADNIIAAGNFDGTGADFGGGMLAGVDSTDIWMAKFDGDANHIWSQAFTGAGEQQMQDVSTTPNGVILLTGQYENMMDLGCGSMTANDVNGFVARFDPGGSCAWDVNVGGADYQSILAAAIDPGGDFYITGRAFGTVDLGTGAKTAKGMDVLAAYYTDDVATGIDAESTPRAARLHQSYPNPFNPATTIPLELDRASNVRLAIYDVNGRHVRTLLDRELGAGPHAFYWDGKDARGESVASGVYFYRLTTDRTSAVRKTVLLK